MTKKRSRGSVWREPTRWCHNTKALHRDLMPTGKATPIPPEQIQVILESIADGVFTVDEDWRITSFNRAAEDITGVPREEAIGRPCCEVFRASICESQCALKRTMETGKPIINRTVYIITEEEERVPISVSTALLRDADGRIIGGVETFRDLSVVEELRKELAGRYTFADIISKNHRMQQLFDILPEVATSDSTVLIEGESGTGKELFARALHNLSPRKTKLFVVVNCGALPENLLESELFGYEAGAFTDAKKDKPGRVALAEGGTLFLDEVGEMSPALQVKLLRFLQERTYEPLGGVEPLAADVRVVAATNQSLSDLVEKGELRLDLYYRINVVTLSLPPIRERGEDIPLLVRHFIARFSQLRGKDITDISPDALAALMSHDFPGNVRELENVIEHAFVLCPSGVIGQEHLPAHLCKGASLPTRTAGLRDAEKQLILDSLRRNKWNRLAAARELGIHKSTLFRKIKALGIELPATDGRSRGD